jgi:hypothetical protein
MKGAFITVLKKIGNTFYSGLYTSGSLGIKNEVPANIWGFMHFTTSRNTSNGIGELAQTIAFTLDPVHKKETMVYSVSILIVVNLVQV